jgi:hypothetical protein
MVTIGTYTGIKVFRVNLTEFINQKLYNDSENMYLIGEDLILKNEVIGRYDGKYAKELDLHQRYTFYHNTVKEWGKEENSYKIVATPDGNQYFEVKFAHPVGETKNETKTLIDADAILAGAYDTDYSKFFIDIDAFLES